MKKLLLGSLVSMMFIVFGATSVSASDFKSGMLVASMDKCGSSKCGGEKKSTCGSGKCGGEKKSKCGGEKKSKCGSEKKSTCGSGKCGGEKKPMKCGGEKKTKCGS